MTATKKAALAISGLAAAVLLGFVSRGSEESKLVVGSGYPRWPAESLSDWVGFADQVSVVTILSERQLPLTDDVRAVGEGYVGREVTARVESSIWGRAGAASVAGDVTLRVAGWTAQDRELRPFAHYEGPRIEVGERFLAALLKTPEGEWSLLSAGSAIPLRSTGAALIERQAQSQPMLAAALEGRSVQQISRLLAFTQPDPIAARYQGLDPDVRAAAVTQARLKLAGPTP